MTPIELLIAGGLKYARLTIDALKYLFM